MSSIAVQRCRPGGRRRPIADATVAALVAVGGLVLAGTVTAGPRCAPDPTTGATGAHHRLSYDGAEGGPAGPAHRALLPTSTPHHGEGAP
ncbi:MAG TPA: hypothetical protein VE546_14860 [Streptomyces sp.]|uniref:hypothetical protein n=1 Tax=Streptomyces sp. TaxID=1931 RepID=UPI002D4257E4|nr:hypothetical protein [Streptomyces sp.]HZG04828.1 hypothetical protein [Streptomyces sp.]